MPDPIRSTTSAHTRAEPSQSTESATAAAQASAAAGGTQTAPAAPAPDFEPSRGSAALSRADSPSAQFASQRGGSAQHAPQEPQPATNTSQQRAAATPAAMPHVDAGVTSAGDSVYLDAALLKGSQGSAELEVAGASVQLGAQREATATLVRMTMHEGNTSTTLETLTAQVASGRYEGNGQSGSVHGALATAVGAETTLQLEGGHSVTVGANIGVGQSTSTEVRDADQDGHDEYCVKVSARNATVGACIEPAALLDQARALWNRL